MNGWLRKKHGDRMSVGPAFIFPRDSGAGLTACIELSKAHLSVYIALSAVAGHVLAQDHFSCGSLVLGGWVFLLAAGSGVLNNIQDREYDLSFPRTRNRVLPRRAFPLERAWIMAFILIGSAGAGLYYSYSSLLPAILGTVALICYNGLYTPMKKTSLWAMVPGTACGMIPPVMGWFAVPGYVCSTDISGLVILTACLGSWQFPHYLLVNLKQGEACWGGHNPLSDSDLHCQVLIWTSLFSLGMALFLVRGWVVNQWLLAPAFALAVLLSPVMGLMLFYPGSRRQEIRAGNAFLTMNLSIFLFLSIMILDRL